MSLKQIDLERCTKAASSGGGGGAASTSRAGWPREHCCPQHVGTDPRAHACALPPRASSRRQHREMHLALGWGRFPAESTGYCWGCQTLEEASSRDMILPHPHIIHGINHSTTEQPRLERTLKDQRAQPLMGKGSLDEVIQHPPNPISTTSSDGDCTTSLSCTKVKPLPVQLVPLVPFLLLAKREPLSFL